MTEELAGIVLREPEVRAIVDTVYGRGRDRRPGVGRVELVGERRGRVVEPLAAVAIARGLDLAPMAATGLILVAASPGGVTSNYATLMARGAVGLSVAMTSRTMPSASRTYVARLAAPTASLNAP